MNLDSGELLAVKQVLIASNRASKEKAQPKYIDGNSNQRPNFMSTAAAPFGVKSNVLKAQKNGGLGGRKALNNISISGRPSTLQTSKKHNPKNVISIGEDIGPSKMTSFGRKRNVSKAPKKAQAGGRKALSDLTNSGKHPHQASKKSQDKKLTVVEEQFLHNHQECIKAQRNAKTIAKATQ